MSHRSHINEQPGAVEAAEHRAQVVHVAEEPTGNTPPTDEQLICVVEIPRGSRNKYEYDAELGAIKLDRPLVTAAVYPTDYGYLRDTLGRDDDPLDALVCLHEPTFAGCLIRVKPIGLFEMIDEHGIDDKVICVPIKDPHWNHYEEVGDLPPLVRLEIEEFFRVYKDLEPDKHVTVKGWGPRAAAIKEIEASRARHSLEAAKNRST